MASARWDDLSDACASHSSLCVTTSHSDGIRIAVALSALSAASATDASSTACGSPEGGDDSDRGCEGGTFKTSAVASSIAPCSAFAFTFGFGEVWGYTIILLL